MTDRKRKVKNALVDIDKISAEAGSNYSNWINICREQLQERELLLLNMKTHKIESIVKNEFKAQNFAIQQEIINNTYNMFCAKLNQWNGVKVNLTKASLSVYTEYFLIAKKWWDNQKRKVYGNIFWVPVFQSIQNIFDNDFRLLLNVINALFNATFKCPNTKQCPLITAGALVRSDQMHKYLYNRHQSLNVEQWVMDSQKGKNGKNIINKLRNALKRITYNPIMSAHNRNANIELKIDPINQIQYTNNNTNYNTNTNNIQNAFAYNNSNQNFNHNVTLNNGLVSQYQCFHSATHAVSDTRYTPLLSSPIDRFQNVPIYLVVNNSLVAIIR